MQSEEALLAVGAQLNKALKIAKLAYWEYDQSNDTFTLNDQYYSIMNTTAEQEGGYIIPTQQLLDHFVYSEDRHILLTKLKKLPKQAKLVTAIHWNIVSFTSGGFGFLIVRYDFIKKLPKLSELFKTLRNVKKQTKL
jgi:hypothetical protein